MIIVLDYDATLVELMNPWLESLKTTHGVNLSTKDIKYFGWLRDALGHSADDFWRTPGIYDTIEPIPRAIEFVDKLLFAGYGIRVCSASDETMFKEKESHCLKHFGLKMIHSHDKHKLTEGCTLIDDCPRHIHAHVRENHPSQGLLFNHNGRYGWAKPLVSHRYIRVVKTYHQILTLLGVQDASDLL